MAQLLLSSFLMMCLFGTLVYGAALKGPGSAAAAAGSGADPANIISHADVKIDSKVVNFRGNPQHKALHIKYENDITINNIVELVQAVYGACVRSKAPDAGRDVCRAKISAVVQNSLNVVFDGVELANHLLINGIKLGEAGSKAALAKVAQELSK